MGCINGGNGCGTSCARTYNNTAQTVAAGAITNIITLGNQVVLTGNGIATTQNGFITYKAGTFHLDALIDILGTTAGDITFSAYLDGVQLPCTVNIATLVADRHSVVPISTDIYFEKLCPCNNRVRHTITFVANSAGAGVGTIVNVCAGMTEIK